MAILLPQGKQQYFTSAGVPLVGGRVYTYDAGTTNPRQTFQDAAAAAPNTNPVILDARGEATIFWAGSYKVVLRDALDVVIWTQDNVSALASTPLDNYSADTGAANAYVAAGATAVNAYVAGLKVALKIANTNTGASTLNYMGLGVRNILMQNGSPTPPGALQAAGIFEFEYDGAAFQLLDPGVASWRTAAEVTAGITPSNVSALPDHIGYDVRRTGVTANGATDDRAALANAAAVGSALYFPRGTYRIGSNLTIGVACFFDFGAILKPDAGVTVTINAPVFAGPWQIFDATTNAGAVITGLIKPFNANGAMYTEWFGAVADGSLVASTGTDNLVPFQKTAKAAFDAGCVPIQLLAGVYKITNTVYGGGANVQSFTSPSWYGIDKRQTTIRLLGAAAGTQALLFRGGSGQMCGASVERIGFKGDANSVGVSFQGQCGMRVKACLFDTNAGGVQFYNNDLGSFTEYCVVDDSSEFTALCVTDIQYVKNLGNTSFHGSGVQNSITNKSGGNSIIIGAGSQPYNAPLGLQIWNQGSTNLINSSSALVCNFHGAITSERFAGTLTLATGNPVYFTGTINAANENIAAATLIQCMALVANSDGSVTPLGARRAYSSSGTTGSFTLSSIAAGITRIIHIRATATNYDWRGVYVIEHNGTGAVGYAYLIGSTLVNNTAGYGAPAVSVDAQGSAVVANGGWVGPTVTVKFAEQAFGEGVINGITQVI
jgi:hypothetical protein